MRDAERTVPKLRRKQDAVRRVFEGRAVRADLKDVLRDPAVNPPPTERRVEQFVQDHLDGASRAAVTSVLGAQGVSLVKGPPGPVKTTLIAELLVQQLPHVRARSFPHPGCDRPCEATIA